MKKTNIDIETGSYIGDLLFGDSKNPDRATHVWKTTPHSEYNPIWSEIDAPVDASSWPLMGYAPGHYSGTCRKCGQPMEDVDKRAYECLPCAAKHANTVIATQAHEIAVTLGRAADARVDARHAMEGLGKLNAELAQELNKVRELVQASVTVGHGLKVDGELAAIHRVQDHLLLESTHQDRATDKRLSLVRELHRAEGKLQIIQRMLSAEHEFTDFTTMSDEEFLRFVGR